MLNVIVSSLIVVTIIQVASAQSANTIKFESDFDRGTSLASLTFTVSGWVVTEGQSHDLEVGQEKSFSGATGDMTFRINRKGSSETATKMYEVVPDYRTTSSKVGSANFAIFGDLEFVISSYSEYETYHISEIMMAQYNSGTSNIWIFGGNRCVGDSVKEESDCQSDDRKMYVICGKQGGSYTFKFYDLDVGKKRGIPRGQKKSRFVGEANLPYEDFTSGLQRGRFMQPQMYGPHYPVRAPTFYPGYTNGQYYRQV